MDEPSKYLKAPTPGAADVLAKLAGLQEELDSADAEMAKADALRNQAPMQGLGLGGGIAAGANNFIQGLSSGIRERLAREHKEKFLPQLSAGKQALFDFMTRRPEPQAPPNLIGVPGQPQMSIQPPSAFGLGGGY